MFSGSDGGCDGGHYVRLSPRDDAYYVPSGSAEIHALMAMHKKPNELLEHISLCVAA